jgi:hypothetical protein
MIEKNPEICGEAGIAKFHKIFDGFLLNSFFLGY